MNPKDKKTIPNTNKTNSKTGNRAFHHKYCTPLYKIFVDKNVSLIRSIFEQKTKHTVQTTYKRAAFAIAQKNKGCTISDRRTSISIDSDRPLTGYPILNEEKKSSIICGS